MSPETREDEYSVVCYRGGGCEFDPPPIPAPAEPAPDPELRALEACVDVLVRLDRNAQCRIATYLQRRFV